ncbi:hypothetical protein V6N11_056782 [Hibiscus sabdariffa]|uniref:Uncharacterized protein n=1 Tax=Hibiscus sabdariffa TaxID=183260 RepID=A0ABR2T579_9ROSI
MCKDSLLTSNILAPDNSLSFTSNFHRQQQELLQKTIQELLAAQLAAARRGHNVPQLTEGASGQADNPDYANS